MKKSGIYVWKLNGVPKYVGKGIDVEKRMNHKHYDSTVLIKAINKYGINAFEKEIITYCEPDEMNDLEIYYIQELDTHVSYGGYNISLGGQGTTGYSHTPEAKEKMSLSKKGKSAWNKGIPSSEETRKNLSESHMGQTAWNKNIPMLDNVKQKLSVALSKENHPLWGKFREKKKNSSSNYYGVGKLTSRGYVYWTADVRINHKKKHIGNFKTELEAAQAYDNFVIENNLPNPLNFKH